MRSVLKMIKHINISLSSLCRNPEGNPSRKHRDITAVETANIAEIDLFKKFPSPG